MTMPGLEPQPLDPHQNSEQATCTFHYTLTAEPPIIGHKWHITELNVVID